MAQDPHHSPVSARAPIVVKLGGSLYPRVPGIVPILRAAERPLLIVPGGGPFANAVREVCVDDDAAHWMAIAAMEQYGWYVASHGLPTSDTLAVPDRPTLLLPYRCLRDGDPLPHSWDVTSDTIAAWVADMLGLDLLLLKSVDGITAGGALLETVTIPLGTDVVDPAFLPFVIEKKIETSIINGSDPERVRQFLAGYKVPGTKTGTTF
ncbi:uridylate kinase [Methanoregula sp.]|jgi:5-(aminomethyl)-3-furanmethanol phosphate kinase|uniref:uridylate kinase n=1 Tax=Methanoregula sp. TaxID=2052170 RepID=UPI003C1C2ED6